MKARRAAPVLWAAVLAGVAAALPAARAPGAEEELARQLAGAASEGLATRPGDLRVPTVSPARDAAPLYRELAAVLERRPPSPAEKRLMASIAAGRPVPHAATWRLEALARAHPRALELARRAAALPACAFSRDWSAGAATPLPEYGAMRRAMAMLCAEALARRRAGHALDAVRTQALGFRMAAHASAEPGLMPYLAATALDTMTLAGLDRLLRSAPDEPRVAAAVREAVRVGWRPRSLARGVRGETLMAVLAIEAMRKGGPPAESPGAQGGRGAYDALVDRNGAAVIAALRRMARAGDLPYRRADTAMKAVLASFDADDPAHILGREVLRVYERLPERRALVRARAHVLSAAAATLAYRARGGAPPERLTQAVAPAPADPFAEGPLAYRRDGAGFVVYSVGPGGAFDGRAPGFSTWEREALFLFPAPVYLQP
ncbi:MAG: hypothetical protein IT208_04765 [Chthonomonadales bacterium]|nr:hypothetical protein [Chthonomonadales bacterium]